MKQDFSKKHGIALALALGLTGLGTGAQAALIAQTVDGVNLVYDTVKDLTWVQDANLFKTQAAADTSLVSTILASYSTVTDIGLKFGSYAVGRGLLASDFTASTGGMTWYGAMAWADWLSHESYGGVSGWRLPSAGASPQWGYNQTSSDLGYLFYTDGQLTSGQSILAAPTGQSASILDGYFDNMKSRAYWFGTEFFADPRFAWLFNANAGNQGELGKYAQFYGWAVRSGQVAVPLPATAWLVALGLMLLGPLGVGRRRLR